MYAELVYNGFWSPRGEMRQGGDRITASNTHGRVAIENSYKGNVIVVGRPRAAVLAGRSGSLTFEEGAVSIRSPRRRGLHQLNASAARTPSAQEQKEAGAWDLTSSRTVRR